MVELNRRRTRLHPGLRELTREARPAAEQFVQPLFVVEGLSEREAVPGLHAVYRDTAATLLEQIAADLERGISKFLLFGVPASKTTHDFEHRFTAGQISAIKQRFGSSIWLAVDVCLCAATVHGHCGIVNDAGDYIVNSASVAALTETALAYAAAGADCVAPSDMMDGRVGAIRAALDAADFERTALMSYSAKFHSAFYGPFRIAADSAPAAAGRELSDRASYQIDPARPRDALLSSLRDDDEGADILMVKPGLPYLDVLAELSATIPKPWAVYQTSGEAAGIELLASAGLTDRERAYREAWTGFVRAGAQIIISYAARDAALWLRA